MVLSFAQVIFSLLQWFFSSSAPISVSCPDPVIDHPVNLISRYISYALRI
jgi:hypothetical protein